MFDGDKFAARQMKGVYLMVGKNIFLCSGSTAITSVDDSSSPSPARGIDAVNPPAVDVQPLEEVVENLVLHRHAGRVLQLLLGGEIQPAREADQLHLGSVSRFTSG